MTPERWIQLAKGAMGAGAALAAFLLVQGDVTVAPLLKVILGGYLVVAAYLNPATVVTKIKRPND